MKSKIALILIVLMLMQIIMPFIEIIPNNVFAVEEGEKISRNYEIKEEESWDVSTYGNGAVTAKWTKKDSKIVISGIGVIDEYGLSNKPQYTNLVKEIVIEDGIYAIEGEAFEDCYNLTEITIPKNIETIGDGVFIGCENLKNIMVDEENPNYKSENGILFSKDKSILVSYPAGKEETEYIVPTEVKSIGGYAFSSCINLENIILGENLLEINKGAFNNCKNITSIKIPSGVSNLSASAFSGCTNLTNIELPENMKNIEGGAFSNCTNLQTIELPKKLTAINSNVFSGCSNLININIPNGVSSIGESAFYGCSNLKEVRLPGSIISIGDSAFYGCRGIENIEIPEGIISIGRSAFGNTALRKVSLPDTLLSIGDNAFEQWTNRVEIIEIPDSVISIGENITNDLTVWILEADSQAHRYAEEHQQRYLLNGEPSNVSTEYKISEQWDISDAQNGSIIAKLSRDTNTLTISGTGEMMSFGSSSREAWFGADCENFIQNVIVEEGVTRIGNYAFKGCTNLQTITMPNSLTQIGSYAFSECSGLNNIVIPEKVTTIGREAFRGCTSLVDVTIPNSVTEMGEAVFSYCNNLININLPDGITSIPNSTFSNCKKLTSIEIPDTVTRIGRSAFWGCESLESVTIPANVSLIGVNQSIYNAFAKCSNLKNIMVDSNNLNYISEDGILFDKNKTILVSYPVGKEQSSYIVPENIEAITELAFYGSLNLKNIELPESISVIGREAFSGCVNLEKINIPENVSSIKVGIFENCASLKNIVIPNGVEVISAYAFSGCSSLNNLEIPEGVKTIEYYAFSECTSLITINIPNTVEIIENNAFEKCVSLNTVTIPSSVNEIEYNAFKECEGLTEVILLDGVKEIGSSVFEDCRNLKKVTIAKTLVEIPDYAFLGCEGLEIIVIPDNISKIGRYAFSGCKSLKDITISKNVTTIEYDTFSGCIGLEKIEIPDGIETIRARAFKNCVNLKRIIIPDTVADIGSDAFDERTVIYTKPNTLVHKYAEESQQGYILDDEGPNVVFTPNGSEKPEKEYSIEIHAEDNEEFVGVNESSLKYQWTQSEEMPTIESFVDSFDNGQIISKDTGDGEWYLWVYVKDNFENETITRSEAFNFDNTAPNGKIEYSTKEITNKNVTVTITSNEEIQEVEGWTLSSDKKVLTKEYTENTKETITIKDLAGNEAQANIEITNIDKNLPEITIGDINQDGRIDVTDLLMLKRHLVAGSRTEWILTGQALLLADMNEDGNVDVTDMLMLKRIIVEDM